MAKTPQAALSFMRGIVPPARQRVLNEQAEIQNVIDGEQGGYTVQAGLDVLCRTGTAGKICVR